MQPPNWKECTEEEAWQFVAWHLEGEGVRSVLVGGAVVAIYTAGLYRSGDLDMVPDGHDDPFDRLLAAQAIESGSTLLSPDSPLSLLGAARLW